MNLRYIHPRVKKFFVSPEENCNTKFIYVPRSINRPFSRIHQSIYDDSDNLKIGTRCSTSFLSRLIKLFKSDYKYENHILIFFETIDHSLFG